MADTISSLVAAEIRAHLARRPRNERTMAWLAAQIGMAPNSLRRKISCVGSITIDDLGMIAAGLGVSPRSLVPDRVA